MAKAKVCVITSTGKRVCGRPTTKASGSVRGVGASLNEYHLTHPELSFRESNKGLHAVLQDVTPSADRNRFYETSVSFTAHAPEATPFVVQVFEDLNACGPGRFIHRRWFSNAPAALAHFNTVRRGLRAGRPPATLGLSL